MENSTPEKKALHKVLVNKSVVLASDSEVVIIAKGGGATNNEGFITIGINPISPDKAVNAMEAKMVKASEPKTKIEKEVAKLKKQVATAYLNEVESKMKSLSLGEDFVKEVVAALEISDVESMY